MKTTEKRVSELIETGESPIPLEIFPNQMGINLLSVYSIKWTTRDDGQLFSITVNFIPEDKN